MIKVRAIRDIKIADTTIPAGTTGLVTSVIAGDPGERGNVAFISWESGTFLTFEDEVERVEDD